MVIWLRELGSKGCPSRVVGPQVNKLNIISGRCHLIGMHDPFLSAIILFLITSSGHSPVPNGLGCLQDLPVGLELGQTALLEPPGNSQLL